MPSIATAAADCHRFIIYHGSEKYDSLSLPQLALANNGRILIQRRWSPPQLSIYHSDRHHLLIHNVG